MSIAARGRRDRERAAKVRACLRDPDRVKSLKMAAAALSIADRMLREWAKGRKWRRRSEKRARSTSLEVAAVPREALTRPPWRFESSALAV